MDKKTAQHSIDSAEGSADLDQAQLGPRQIEAYQLPSREALLRGRAQARHLVADGEPDQGFWGDPAVLQEALQEMQRRQPNDWRIPRAFALLHGPQATESLEYLTQALRLAEGLEEQPRPDALVELHWLRGISAAQQKNNELAEQDLRTSVALAETEPERFAAKIHASSIQLAGLALAQKGSLNGRASAALVELDKSHAEFQRLAINEVAKVPSLIAAEALRHVLLRCLGRESEARETSGKLEQALRHPEHVPSSLACSILSFSSEPSIESRCSSPITRWAVHICASHPPQRWLVPSLSEMHTAMPRLKYLLDCRPIDWQALDEIGRLYKDNRLEFADAFGLTARYADALGQPAPGPESIPSIAEWQRLYYEQCLEQSAVNSSLLRVLRLRDANQVDLATRFMAQLQASSDGTTQVVQEALGGFESWEKKTAFLDRLHKLDSFDSPELSAVLITFAIAGGHFRNADTRSFLASYYYGCLQRAARAEVSLCAKSFCELMNEYVPALVALNPADLQRELNKSNLYSFKDHFAATRLFEHGELEPVLRVEMEVWDSIGDWYEVHLMALLYGVKHNFSGRIDHWSELAEEPPDTLAALAGLSLELGHYQDAQRLLEIAASNPGEKDAESELLSLVHFQHLLLEGKPEQAMQALENRPAEAKLAIAQSAGFAQLLESAAGVSRTDDFALAVAQLRSNQRDRAQETLKTSLAAGPLDFGERRIYGSAIRLRWELVSWVMAERALKEMGVALGSSAEQQAQKVANISAERVELLYRWFRPYFKAAAPAAGGELSLSEASI